MAAAPSLSTSTRPIAAMGIRLTSTVGVPIVMVVTAIDYRMWGNLAGAIYVILIILLLVIVLVVGRIYEVLAESRDDQRLRQGRRQRGGG